jgi:spermidine dehydrogenase
MGKSKDSALGMSRQITRRDFLDGVALTIGAAAVPLIAIAQDKDSLSFPPPEGQGADESAQEPLLAKGISEKDPRYYPPALTGMRGSHPGSFEAAHKLRNQGTWDLSKAVVEDGVYDLVIVGGGMSGLAAAYFYVKNMGREVRVLVLDNHDDFGGHAKRNEFTYNGRTMVLNGGTVNIESVEHYNAPALELLRDVGIDLDRYVASNAGSRDLYKSLGLGAGHFFDKETWGSDRLLRGGASEGGGKFTAEFLAQTPLSAQAQKDTLRLYDSGQPDYMPGLSSAEKKQRLASISYQDFLLNHAKVDKQILWFLQGLSKSFFQVGIDASPAYYMWMMGLPGFSGMKLEPTPDGTLSDLPGGQHGRQKETGHFIHFPDGNATVARLLVRWLIAEAVPGTTMESVATARVNYALLDRPDQTARIRLNSTVVNVKHSGNASSAKEVIVSYAREGKTYQVRGRACVMACWNMFIPYLVPELPAKQKEALAYGVKRPLVITNVAIRNWQAFKKLGLAFISTPTMFFREIALSEPVSLGDLRGPQTPDDPHVLVLEHVPTAPGLPIREQHRLGRMQLMQTSYETFERNVRDQLGRVLGSGGFNPANDIVAVTVNRWSHGYAYSYNSLYDPPEWAFTSSNERPCVVGRQPFGLITIANSDAAASSHTDAAILMAYEAICYAIDRRAMPLLG